MIAPITFVALAALLPSVLAGPKKISPTKIPHTTEPGQTGYNDCGTADSATSGCQTLWINDLQDFCLFAPPTREPVGDSEERNVAYCTKAGHGARLIPPGTLKGVHLVYTDKYVQITGVGDFTKINIPKGDEGGELDPHGATNIGNPIGGLIFIRQPNGKVVQAEEWTEYISDGEFAIRACYNMKGNRQTCGHIYDTMGARWNMPANYGAKVFETCQGAAADPPMGIYPQPDGSTSTFHQGDAVTPDAHPAPSSSQCVRQKTVAGALYGKATPTSPTGPTKKSVASPQQAAAEPAPAPAKPVSAPKAASPAKPGKIVTKPKKAKAPKKPTKGGKKTSAKGHGKEHRGLIGELMDIL